MNSIRPLITITVLVVAGAFLYVKINESPVRPPGDASDAWNQPPEGIPPLGAASGTSAAESSAAPPWPAAQSPAPAATDAMPAVAEVTETPSPDVPPMPEMPEVATATEPSAAATASVPLPTELPANIPTARYPDQPAVAPAATPESVNAASPIASQSTSLPLASQPNSLRQTAEQAPVADPLAPGVSTPTQASSATTAPAETTFVQSWPAIQAALERGELALAHQLLSRWYDDPSLTPTDAERVESLLSQLAGTVVYSTEHQLAPAHVMKPGETLETIGREYNVPWQLLAKINGIAAVDQVQPGQELKVVPGPFSAVVDLTRNQLVLMVDGRYAGKFVVSTPRDIELPTGDWLVREKLGSYAGGNQPTPAGAAAPATAARKLVLQSAAATSDRTGPAVVIGSEPAIELRRNEVNGVVMDTPIASPYHVKVSPGDAEELVDILSIGSRVVIRR